MSTGAGFLPPTVASEKWMLGRQSFPFGVSAYFEGELLVLGGVYYPSMGGF